MNNFSSVQNQDDWDNAWVLTLQFYYNYCAVGIWS